MANTTRMAWPFPNENIDPWYEALKSWATAMDSSGFASREDRQLILAGGGSVTWDAGTSTLTWDSVIQISSPITGFLPTVAAGSLTIDAGHLFYVTLTRGPTSNVELSASVANQVPSNDVAMVLAVRIGDIIYWRNGLMMNDGDSFTNLGSSQGGAGGAGMFEEDAVENVIQPIVAQIGRGFIVGSQDMDDSGVANDYRMFFDKAKGAFRAGAVLGTEWDDVNRGGYSSAFGVDTVASGWGSHAEGLVTESTEVGTHSEGLYTAASGYSSHAEGFGSRARLLGSHASAGGWLDTPGDAQTLRLTTGTKTTVVGWRKMSLDYDTGILDAVMVAGAVWNFIIQVVAKSTTGGDAYSAIIEGCAMYDGGNIQLIGTADPLLPRTEFTSANTVNFSCRVNGVVGDENFDLEVYSDTTTDYHWAASLHIAEVIFEGGGG